MSALPGLVIQFLAVSAVILWAGVRLSRYGDMIAEKTGVGGTFVGLLLMAGVTSLPELITGTSAVVVYGARDIAAGDAIGSCMFNLLILAALDLRHELPLSTRIHQGHVLTAAFGIVQLGLVAMAIVAGVHAPAVGWVGAHSLVFIGIYVLAMRTIFVFERSRLGAVGRELAARESYAHVSVRVAMLRYAATASVLVAAAAYLPGLGESLARATGLGSSLVGSLFVATTTSLPEIVVSVAAARMGAVDMAAANLFGSNLFNVAILGIDDLADVHGPLLQAVSPVHLVTLSAAIMMTGVAIVGMTFRAGHKRFRLSWDTIALVAIYVAALLLLRVVS
jgi:cation:H+ antiporter